MNALSSLLQRAAVGLSTSLLIAACAPSPRWQTSPELMVSNESLSEAFGDFQHERTRPFSPSDVPNIPMPKALRPCCAFGTDLKVKVGAAPVPGFKLDNMRAAEDLGPHNYENGLLTLNPADDRRALLLENNGLVYTCRGGFIDVAHVRDNADLALYLATQAARNMVNGGEAELPDQGARLRAVFQPIPGDVIEHHGWRELAATTGSWLAFQVSIWHEIATWYGYASLSTWPEKLSAFSPEDLYSNMIGVRITRAIILSRQVFDDHMYNRAVDAWLSRLMERLQPVSKDDGITAMRSVDGIWWDSTQRLPDWKVTLRRNMEIGPEIYPWLVTSAHPPLPGRKAFEGCPEDAKLLPLRNPQGFEGLPFPEVAVLQIDVGDSLIEKGFPLPREGDRRITQADFPFVIEAIRHEVKAAMGPLADQPINEEAQ
jgi:hypothetical protein